MDRKRWNILIVDDEDDVHQVTDLALKREKFYGIRVRLHHCKSGKEAKEFVLDNPWLFYDVAVCLVDVVMETETAGLEFCRHVREDWNMGLTQLILRTGQPGQAPEREVATRYHITNFLSKSEATGDRLYLSIKAGIENWFVNRYAVAMPLALATATKGEVNLDEVAAGVTEQWTTLCEESQDWWCPDVGLEIGGRYIHSGQTLEDKAAFDELKAELTERARDEKKERPLIDGDVYGPARAQLAVGRVDSHVIASYTSPRTGASGTWIWRDTLFPEGYDSVVGPHLLTQLGYLTELLS